MYKRFTEKRKGKNVIPLLDSVCGVDLPKWTIAKESEIRRYLSGDAVNRLAELEDKIENGTLIDTKVKIGQRVYRRGFFKGEIDEYIVSNIILENGELKLHLKHDFDEHKTCYSATVLDIEEIGKTVFLTKAEAKLKENRYERNFI